MFDAVLRRWPNGQGRDLAGDMIDSTVIRSNDYAVGIKRRFSKQSSSRGRFNTNPQSRCDARGHPIRFVLTPGKAHDVQGFAPLVRMIENWIEAFRPDRAYDADAVCEEIFAAGVEAVIPAERKLVVTLLVT